MYKWSNIDDSDGNKNNKNLLYVDRVKFNKLDRRKIDENNISERWWVVIHIAFEDEFFTCIFSSNFI